MPYVVGGREEGEGVGYLAGDGRGEEGEGGGYLIGGQREGGGYLPGGGREEGRRGLEEGILPVLGGMGGGWLRRKGE